MRAILLFLVLAGSIPFIFVKPYIGVMVWSWLGYMNPHRLTWGIGDTIPLSLIVAAITIFAWLISKEPKNIPWTTATRLLAAFTAWMCLTTLFAEVSVAAFAKWQMVMKNLLMIFVTLALFRNRQRLDLLIWVIVLSVGFYGFKGGIFAILTEGKYLVWGPDQSQMSGSNGIGLALVMILPLMRYLQQQARHWTISWGMLLTAGFCGLAAITTYSRGAFLALGVMLVALWFKSPKKLLTGGVMAIVVIASLSVMPDKWFDRMHSIETYQDDDSALRRIEMWRLSWKIAQNRPVLGGGFEILNNFALYAKHGFTDFNGPRSAHSIYFEVLVEHSYIGLALYLLLGLATLLSGGWIIRRTRDRPELEWAGNLARMTQVSIVGFAVGGAFVNKAYFDLYYHLIAIMVLTRHIVASELDKVKAAGTGQAAEGEASPRLVPPRSSPPSDALSPGAPSLPGA